MKNPLTYTDPTGRDVSIKLNFEEGVTEQERQAIIAHVRNWDMQQGVGNVIRTVRRALLVHTAFVVVMVLAKNALWASDAPWWAIRRVFRLAEFPVLRIVDSLLQTMPLMPSALAFERMWVATSVSEIILYGIVGGAFYALAGAAIAYVRQRKQVKRTGAR